MTEQQIIDWMSARWDELLADNETSTLTASVFANHIERMLYFAAGRHFQVRLVIDPPSNPPRRDFRKTL